MTALDLDRRGWKIADVREKSREEARGAAAVHVTPAQPCMHLGSFPSTPISLVRIDASTNSVTVRIDGFCISLDFKEVVISLF